MNGKQFKKVIDIIGISKRNLSKKSGVGLKTIESYTSGINNINNHILHHPLHGSRMVDI